MTELSFLIDLLLNHKLPRSTRDAVAARIKEVEVLASTTVMRIPASVPITPAMLANQAPSTLAAMARHADLPGVVDPGVGPRAPAPVAVVAQTPAAVAAMNSRSQAIAESMAGKVDKSTGRPRKW